MKMKTKNKNTITRWLMCASLSAAGALTLGAQNAQAQSQCRNAYDCWDGDWFTIDWCHQGECHNLGKSTRECKQPQTGRCWWDQQCDDGNPNTVNWCQWNWWSWSGGSCYAAPIDGSACGQPPAPRSCRRNFDCRDGNRNTRNWCYEGLCYEVQRDEAACEDEQTSCRRARDCRDGDRNTLDWCYRGSCYHAPKDAGGSCEPQTQCDPDACPQDDDPCTQAACDDQDQCIQEPVADGSACAEGAGLCFDGACRVCEASQCADDNECTASSCDSQNQCVNTPVTDGTGCSQGQCSQGQCVECIVDADCAEPSACKSGGTCEGNICQPGEPVVCQDDGNPCTVESCDDSVGCRSTPVADGTACGDGLSCQAGVCTPDIVCPPVEVVLEHTRRGSVNNPLLPGNWKVEKNSYQIRWINFNGANVPASSSYHCFDLSGVNGTILDARIEMTHPDNSYDSADASETVVFRSMDIPCDDRFDAAPDMPPADRNAIFGDLNRGDILAQFEATASDNTTTESFPVNAAGIASLQAGAGNSSTWGIGGGLSSADRPTQLEVERIFRGSNDKEDSTQPSTKVILTVRPEQCEQNPPQTTSLDAVELGYYLRAIGQDSGTIYQSFHFEANTGEHKTYFVGNQSIGLPTETINADRRAYFVFDGASVSNAISAKLRVWGWQPVSLNGNSGAYNSLDAQETVSLYEVTTPANEIISAPYNDIANPAIDVPIWTDLGDGTVYGQRVYTEQDERVDLVPGPNAPADTVCDPDTDSPCGKWLEFDLNADAVAALNAASGQWTIGAAMTSIQGVAGTTEWVNNGTLVDLKEGKDSYPDLITPAPQLIIVSQ